MTFLRSHQLIILITKFSKVFFLDDVALVCKCLDMFKACFTYNLVESEHTVRNLDFFMSMSTALTFEMHYSNKYDISDDATA